MIPPSVHEDVLLLLIDDVTNNTCVLAILLKAEVDALIALLLLRGHVGNIIIDTRDQNTTLHVCMYKWVKR